MDLPSEIPVLETLAFVRSALPAPARVLEVGCGTGRLAVRLLADGHQVRAIDLDRGVVSAARARGVDARVADVRSHRDDPFDAVLFTRSLHHMDPLADAVDRAWSLVRPGGVLVVEEFAVEAADAVTAEWAADLGQLLIGDDPVDDPMARWVQDHPHVHTARAMVDAIGARFTITRQETAPYLYRTLCARLDLSDRGLRIGRGVLDIERRRIAVGTLKPLGLRIVATPKPRS